MTGKCQLNVPTFGCRGDMLPTCRQLSQPRLNVLVFVGELAVQALSTKMLCRTKEFRDGSCGSQVMPIVVTQSLGSTFSFGANNLPSRNVSTRAPISVVKIVTHRSDGLTFNN